MKHPLEAEIYELEHKLIPGWPPDSPRRKPICNGLSG